MHIVPDDIDFESYLQSEERQYIKKASDWSGEVVEYFQNPQGASGDPLPWSKTDSLVGLRPGEVSIWCGINGHGKSLVLGQVVLWMLPSSNALIASLEMKPAATLERMLRQASGSSQPSEGYINTFLSWTDDRLWIYDQLDSVESDRILGMIHYAAKELGINHIVIDSLMKCGIKTDDYNAQKNFVDRLCWAAKNHGVHIHLVHHMRKREREGHVPDKFDVRGASEIVDLVDNLFIMHRNKDKEKLIEKGEEVDEGRPDATLIVGKQRHGEWEGRIALYFDKPSLQFVPSPRARAMPWPNAETQLNFRG